jgi:SAM-dependent methyltransferase
VRLKPRGLDRQYGEQFCDESVVAAYCSRPPYSDALIALILENSGGAPPHILDLGCGTGELARRLAPHVQAVTAIDQSERMVNEARALPGGDAPNITWIVGRVEDGPLSGPFSCALAAESFHWFDWHELWPRLTEWLPSSRLILAERRERQSPWSAELAPLIAAFSTNRDFERFELPTELTARRIFSVEGRTALGPDAFHQSIGGYITSIHSRNGFSRDRMSAEAARQFDAAVQAAVAPYATDGTLVLSIETLAVWGRIQSLED